MKDTLWIKLSWKQNNKVLSGMFLLNVSHVNVKAGLIPFLSPIWFIISAGVTVTLLYTSINLWKICRMFLSFVEPSLKYLHSSPKSRLTRFEQVTSYETSGFQVLMCSLPPPGRPGGHVPCGHTGCLWFKIRKNKTCHLYFPKTEDNQRFQTFKSSISSHTREK